MKNIFIIFTLISTLASCSNTPELESGEIRTLQFLRDAISQSNKSNIFVNSRDILSRKQIDAAAVPVLFVKLESGQNGTFTRYPGQGVGQTWLGADGATITFEQGVLKASRGMGADLMGSSSSMPAWKKLRHSDANYRREVSFITGNNKILRFILECEIKKNDRQEKVEIWALKFLTTKYDESCYHKKDTIRNVYFVDNKNIVRKSRQYHSKKIGYIVTERLDR
ncbi:MAG: YjbF family lipoprotein [Emcibacteraceae bacterium]|nr:YjbF family lipoprotein [Emcibacteraceae bacterium]